MLSLYTRCLKCRTPFEMSFVGTFVGAARVKVFRLFDDGMRALKRHGCVNCANRGFELPLYTDSPDVEKKQ